MTDRNNIENLIEFLETNIGVNVFASCKDRGWITEEEWAIVFLGDGMSNDDYSNMRDMLALFVLLAEGEEF